MDGVACSFGSTADLLREGEVLYVHAIGRRTALKGLIDTYNNNNNNKDTKIDHSAQ